MITAKEAYKITISNNADAYLNPDLDLLITAAAQSGQTSMNFKLPSVLSIQDATQFLMKQGYSVSHQGGQIMRISWKQK